MTDCIFKAGEEYVTRDGGKARIYATDSGGQLPIHGAVTMAGDCQWYINEWTSSGRYLASEAPHPNDLMPPKRVAWVNLYQGVEGDFGWAFGPKEECEKAAQEQKFADRIACIRVEYVPGQFDEEES